MQQPSTILAAILNWNGAGMTLECVRHVLAQDQPGVGVTVIDNGSRHDDVAALRRGLPAGCRLHSLASNRGFVGGMNVGLRAALRDGTEYVWLLNNDAFPELECLARLVSAMAANPALAAVTPLLYDREGREQHAGGLVDWTGAMQKTFTSGEIADGVPYGGWITGTALLLRVSALRAVGILDSRFFAYWEEVDLCIRLAQRGYHCRAVPEARCLHLGSASTGGNGSPFSEYLMTRNAWLFLRKHVTARRRAAVFVEYVSAKLRKVARAYAGGEVKRVQGMLEGLAAAVDVETGIPKLLGQFPALTRFVAQHPWRIIWGLELMQRLFGAA